MVTTATADGRLEARPMTRQDSAFDGRIRFLAPRDGDLVSEIHADSAEYWDSSGSTIAHVASFVRAAVSGDDHTPDLGTSGTVEL